MVALSLAERVVQADVNVAAHDSTRRGMHGSECETINTPFAVVYCNMTSLGPSVHIVGEVRSDVACVRIPARLRSPYRRVSGNDPQRGRTPHHDAEEHPGRAPTGRADTGVDRRHDHRDDPGYSHHDGRAPPRRLSGRHSSGAATRSSKSYSRRHRRRCTSTYLYGSTLERRLAAWPVQRLRLC